MRQEGELPGVIMPGPADIELVYQIFEPVDLSSCEVVARFYGDRLACHSALGLLRTSVISSLAPGKM
jgi:hypothetical protein